MKKTIAAALLLAMLLTLWAGPALAAEEPTVTVTTEGTSTAVTLTVKAAAVTTNGKLEVTYPAGVSLDTYAIAGVVTDAAQGDGVLTFGYALPMNQALKAGETIATLTFQKVGSTRSASFTVDVKEFNASSLENVSLPVSYTFSRPSSPSTPSSPGGFGGGGPVPPEKEPEKTPTPVFKDVAETHWANSAVSYVAEKGYFKGTGDDTFSPDVTMNRGMFVTVLGRLAGADETLYSAAQFSDVPTGSYYAAYVAWGETTGLVKGTSDTTFSPDAPVSREQMALLFYRYAAYAGLDVTVDEDALASFADADQVSEWAREAMCWAVTHQILRGSDTGRLMPTDSATRAQVAQVLKNFDDNMGRTDGAESEAQK